MAERRGVDRPPDGDIPTRETYATEIHVTSRVRAPALLALVALGCLGAPATSAQGHGVPPIVSTIAAPDGVDIDGVEWLQVAVPGLGVMRAAVARPQGTGPFPALVILHGSHGFARQYVELARDMARSGMVVVAPCWFTGGGGAGSRFVTPIECPAAPPRPPASSAEAQRTVTALVQAVRTLPGVRRDRVALFGHSRGAGAALHHMLEGGAVRAVVLNSSGYSRELADRVPAVRVPILILHGTADSPADGGSEMTDVRMARAFEEALRRAGKPVEAVYFDDGEHNGIFASTSQRGATVQRILVFLQRHLVD